MIERVTTHPTNKLKELLEDLQKNNDQLFLFLDSDYFENSVDEVKAIEFHARIELLWENTPLWDKFKNDGPILVELKEDSILIPYFFENWSNKNTGVILQSSFTLEEVFQHLQSLIFTEEPDMTLTRLRLYEPRKLRGLINAMQTDTYLEAFMGPIEKIIWQENCGKEISYLKAENPKPKKPKHTIADEHWFKFTKAQNDIIAQNEVRYFFRNLAWQLSEEYNLEIEDAQEKSEKLTREARRTGFLEHIDMETYVKLRIEHGDFRKNPKVQESLNNKDYRPSGRLTEIKLFLQESHNQMENS